MRGVNGLDLFINISMMQEFPGPGQPQAAAGADTKCAPGSAPVDALNDGFEDIPFLVPSASSLDDPNVELDPVALDRLSHGESTVAGVTYYWVTWKCDG